MVCYEVQMAEKSNAEWHVKVQCVVIGCCSLRKLWQVYNFCVFTSSTYH